jgi:hypothetical protein
VDFPPTYLYTSPTTHSTSRPQLLLLLPNFYEGLLVRRFKRMVFGRNKVILSITRITNRKTVVAKRGDNEGNRKSSHLLCFGQKIKVKLQVRCGVGNLVIE